MTYDSSDDETQVYISDGEQAAQWEQQTTSAMSPAIVGTALSGNQFLRLERPQCAAHARTLAYL